VGSVEFEVSGAMTVQLDSKSLSKTELRLIEKETTVSRLKD
jgi:hypothetical protein